MALLQSHLLAGADTNCLRDRFVAALLPLLNDTPVLRTLSRLQRTLDPLDIEGLSRLWNDSSPSKEEPTDWNTSNYMQPSVEEWSFFLDRYLSLGHSLDHDNPDKANLRYHMLAYLLSATFKDCSIMLNVNRENEQHNAVRVIDLDIKDIGRLAKWQKLDQEIVEAYTRVEHVKCCVDAHGDI